MKNKKIIAVHLLNDFSGSPLVLSNCIEALVGDGYEVDLYSSGVDGFLSACRCNHFKFNYKRFENKGLTLFAYFISQVLLFFLIIGRVIKVKKIYRPTIVVNTLLPFGAALAGRLAGCKVVYYVHETSIRPLLFKRFLKVVLRLTANSAIYVSNFLKTAEGINCKNSRVIESVVYNSLPIDFSFHSLNVNRDGFSVFMPCSLKTYKGVYEFVGLAKSLNEFDIKFVLALNAEEKEFSVFVKEVGSVSNLQLIRRPENINELYAKSSLVLNLSKPDEWVETFGMTVIEAFSHGCPVIVPPVGGIAELVESGFNGYKLSVENMPLISQKVMQIYRNKKEFCMLSGNALRSSNNYLFSEYKHKILDVL